MHHFRQYPMPEDRMKRLQYSLRSLWFSGARQGTWSTPIGLVVPKVWLISTIAISRCEQKGF
jgi:hypothetical protein